MSWAKYGTKYSGAATTQVSGPVVRFRVSLTNLIEDFFYKTFPLHKEEATLFSYLVFLGKGEYQHSQVP